MSLEAKQLLDELMGRDRNLAPTEKNFLTWTDPEVCKPFLVKFCFNDLFVNTKADMGPCPKIHDDKMKKEYENSSRHGKAGYEEEFISYCDSMLSEVDRRIHRANARLALSNRKQQQLRAAQQPEPKEETPLSKANEEQVNALSDRIGSVLKQMEQLGCEGKVEEAQGLMNIYENLKDERNKLTRSEDGSSWLLTAESQEKQMEVCKMCGAFLIVGDAPQRVDDHLMGKQHMGYTKVKNAKAEVENSIKAMSKDRGDREHSRSRRHSGSSKHKERERSSRNYRSRSPYNRRSNHNGRSYHNRR